MTKIGWLPDNAHSELGFKIKHLMISGDELWAINLDGTNKHKVNIVLPSGWELENEENGSGNRKWTKYYFINSEYYDTTGSNL